MTKNLKKIALALALTASATALIACTNEPTQQAAAQPEVITSVDDMLADVNDQMARMNYGEAARAASKAQDIYPGDYRIHVAAARAQAMLNDPVASATAFERAVSTGLPEIAKVFAEPAFNNVRTHNAFAKYRTRATATSAPLPRDTTSYIRSGDVEIIESASGDVIRAGDLVLDTRH